MSEREQRRFQIGDRIQVGFLGDKYPYNYEIAKIFDLRDYRYYPNGDMNPESIIIKTQAFIRFDDWHETSLNDLYSDGLRKIKLVNTLEGMIETLDERYDIFVETFSLGDMDLIDKLENMSFEHNMELIELPDFEQNVYDFVKEKLNDPEWRENIKEETQALYEQDLINDMDLSCGLYNMDTLYLEAIADYALSHKEEVKLNDSIYDSDEFDAYLYHHLQVDRQREQPNYCLE